VVRWLSRGEGASARAVLAGWCLEVLCARSCVRLIGGMDLGQAFDARVGSPDREVGARVNSAFPLIGLVA